MKALIKENREIGLSLKHIDKPIPKPGHLLVKVRACSICGGDNYLYKWTKIMDTWNIPLPLLIGHEFCGDIVEIGGGLREVGFNFKIGDRITADSHLYCNTCSQCLKNRRHNCANVKVFGIHTNGGFAEYVNVPAHIAFKIPEFLSYEEGALLEPFGVGVKSFYLANPTISDRVAIFGAGPIGLFIAKLCIAAGIEHTFVIEPADFRRTLAKKIGATLFEVSGLEEASAVRDRFDIVFEASGTAVGLQQAMSVAAANGKLIVIGAQQDKVLLDIKNDIMLKELIIKGTFGRLIWDTWYQMIAILDNSSINLNEFITHRYGFDQFEEAFSISLTGNCGKIILFPEKKGGKDGRC